MRDLPGEGVKGIRVLQEEEAELDNPAYVRMNQNEEGAMLTRPTGQGLSLAQS